MENVGLWLAGGGAVIALLTSLMTFVLPLLVLGGLAWYLMRRGQKVSTTRLTAQSWPTTKGTVLAASA